MPGGHVNLSLSNGASFSAVHTIDEPLRREIVRIGGNPDEYNRIVWPIGASRHMSAKVLLHRSILDEITDGFTNFPTVLQLSEGIDLGILFVPVWIRNPVPLLVSEGSDAIYSVEIVDQRFFFRTIGTFQSPGFNVSLDDKSTIYQSTGNGGMPFTARTALEALLHQANDVSPVGFIYEISSAIDGLNDEADPRDFITECLPIGEMIDKICAMIGAVCLAYPFSEYPGAGAGLGNYLRITPISDGAQVATSILSTFNNDIIGGGLHAPVGDDITPPKMGAGSKAFGPSGWAAMEIPSQITVMFPKAASVDYPVVFNDETETEDGLHWVPDRWYGVTTNIGVPIGASTNGTTRCIFDTTWAIETGEGIENAELLEARAELMAARYYSRFESGACNLLLRGFQAVPIFSGCQQLTWSFNDAGLTTRLQGWFHDRLFGFRYDDPIASMDVSSTGLVRAIPRSDGGILFDAPSRPTEQGQRTIIGVIQAVYGEMNATYDVIRCPNSLDDPDEPELFEDVTPYDRIIDPPLLDWFPRQVGDVVLIMQCGGGVSLITEICFFEKAFWTVCPNEQQGIESQGEIAELKAAYGVI